MTGIQRQSYSNDAVLWEAVRAKMVETLIPLYLDATTGEATARAKIEAEIAR